MGGGFEEEVYADQCQSGYVKSGYPNRRAAKKKRGREQTNAVGEVKGENKKDWGGLRTSRNVSIPEGSKKINSA